MSVRCRSASLKPGALGVLLALGLAILVGACGSATLKATDGGAGASGKGGSSGVGGAAGASGLAGAGGGVAGPACVLDSTQLDNCILK